MFSPLAAPSSIAWVRLWTAGATALLGSYDAVSGASASVSGLVKYVDTTPVGTPTNYVVEPVGEPFKYRITVTSPGVDIDKNYFDCIPLPPGLTINTNPGAAGYITGTPIEVGTYLVTLVAGNLNYPTPATAPATIVIYPTNAPPVIVTQPRSLSLLAGSNATFSVTAEGSLPMGYQWLRNRSPIPGRNLPSLTLTNVSSTLAGDYQAAVTNAYGAVTSAVARLTIREPFLLELRLGSVSVISNGLRFEVTGPINTNYILWSSADLRAWEAIQTNWVLDGYLEFVDPDAMLAPRRFYRASLGR
jgi:hypothetical protein